MSELCLVFSYFVAIKKKNLRQRENIAVLCKRQCKQINKQKISSKIERFAGRVVCGALAHGLNS